MLGKLKQLLNYLHVHGFMSTVHFVFSNLSNKINNYLRLSKHAPTNGFTALHHKISKRYFFETDMLFRLNTLRAVVMLSGLTVIVGLQFILTFLAQDISAVPSRPFID